mmetsp:Transcript_35410/g.110719  ORF Transcript_35410/g.110719 Transcript_35410/m.110719 type:complete len:441 (-) Transcript_35410:55-1377(-)
MGSDTFMPLIRTIERKGGETNLSRMSAPAASVAMEEEEDSIQATPVSERKRELPAMDLPLRKEKKSCLPALPYLATPQAVWDDVCQMAKSLAEATPDNDYLRSCEILSEEEFLQRRLNRIERLLSTYKSELETIDCDLKRKKEALHQSVQLGLAKSRLGGRAYAGWSLSQDDVSVEQSGERDGNTSCCALGDGESVCGMVCLPFSSFCAECISQDAEQALYHRCPETGKSTIRQVSSSQLARFQLEKSQQQAREEKAEASSPADSFRKIVNKDTRAAPKLDLPFALENHATASPQLAISTPDRKIAASLSAAAIGMTPFPHAAAISAPKASSASSDGKPSVKEEKLAESATRSGAPAQDQDKEASEREEKEEEPQVLHMPEEQEDVGESETGGGGEGRQQEDEENVSSPTVEGLVDMMAEIQELRSSSAMCEASKQEEED